ncbi:hypothetical protein D3C85_1239420 [compost metagenome]
MMLIEASWPSNSEAAVTNRTLLVGVAGVVGVMAPLPVAARGLGAAVLLTSERSVIVSTARICGWRATRRRF